MNPSPAVSVVICTHNPSADPLRRTLEALRLQTLPSSDWELIVVDNASREPLAGRVSLDWQPRGRHVGEPELGLTRARLRGIAEAAGELLVFVDDDNVLAPDYLESALAISGSRSFLGTWGGQVLCEFAVPPPPWLASHLGMLGRKVAGEQWSNLTADFATMPYGAGMCVRRTVARAYAERVGRDPLRLKLGRRGAELSSAEDNDIAYTACQLGLGNGLFERLQLRHLIPASRMTVEYIARLASAMAFSHSLLRFIWNGEIRPEKGPRSERLFEIYRDLRQSREDRAVARAWRDGQVRAARYLRSLAPPA